MLSLLPLLVALTSAAPPPWLAWKPALTPADLERKKEGWYVTGLPIFNYDPNTGFGLGARGYLFFDGKRDDLLFPYEPYRHRLFLQAFFSTLGLQYHVLDYDAPYFLGTPFRARLEVGYIRATNTPYFGRGEATLQPLTFLGQTYARFSDYERAQNAVQPDGTTYALYDVVDAELPYVDARVERQFLEGRLRLLGGFTFSHGRMRAYEAGRTVNAVAPNGETVQAPLHSSRFAEDCAPGTTLVGCEGGFVNLAELGVSWDTRDYEPDPNSGVFAEATLQWATKGLGSTYEFLKFLAAVRVYYSPFPELADLVLAGRFSVQLASDGVPVFSQQLIPYQETFTLGLGGNRTLRGYRAMRFVGAQMLWMNLELRWTFVRFKVLGQQFGIIAAPFFDSGSVYDRVGSIALGGWKYTAGSGLRLSWNQATILMCDVGFSSEDWGIYLNFGHIF